MNNELKELVNILDKNIIEKRPEDLNITQFVDIWNKRICYNSKHNEKRN